MIRAPRGDVVLRSVSGSDSRRARLEPVADALQKLPLLA
jgi:hypothetical protein